MRAACDPTSVRGRVSVWGACSNATTPYQVAFEEALSRVPSRDGCFSAGRRGPYPDPAPRRPLCRSLCENTRHPLSLARACTPSQAEGILPTQAKRRVGGGEAGYKTATHKVRRGCSDRALSARGTSESEPHSGSLNNSKEGRVGAPCLTSAVANRAGGLRDERVEGRVGAPVLTSHSNNDQPNHPPGTWTSRRVSAGAGFRHDEMPAFTVAVTPRVFRGISGLWGEGWVDDEEKSQTCFSSQVERESVLLRTMRGSETNAI